MLYVTRPGQRVTVLLALALLLSPFSASAQNWFEENTTPSNWTATWATASKTQVPGFDAELPSISDATIRQIVRISEGGRQVRVALTNEFGTAPLNIGAAWVAIRDSGSAVVSGSGSVLTFGGSSSIAIAPGGRAISDAVDMRVDDLAELVVSIYLPDDVTGSGSPVSYHVRALQTNYIASGNQSGADDLTDATTTTSWYFLSSVEVANFWPMPVIATIGDSITDGDQLAAPNEPLDLNDRYPDFLAEAIVGGGKAAGVLNLGISGNQVTVNFLGDNPLARLDRDVLSQTGVTHVVVMAGINDIGLPGLLSILGIPTPEISADAIIETHQQIASRARAAGLTVIGGTLPPSGGSFLPGYSGETVEAKRQAVNEWIRNSGAYDAVADFDAALADAADPTIMAVELTSDGLHPNSTGYEVMAGVVFGAVAAGLPAKRAE